MVVCAAFVSCKWWHETFDTVEDCTKWYLDNLYEAAMDNDKEEFDDIVSDMREWVSDLSQEDQQKYIAACAGWGTVNPEKIMKIDEFGFGGAATRAAADYYDLE